MKLKNIKSVRWDITNKCNLNCIHCFTIDNPGTDISCSKALRIIEKLLPLGLEEINFAGREPTLRHDLPEIVNQCSRRNIRVNVTTNGTVLNREGYIALLNSGLHMLVFSLDGVSRVTHDRVRGRGSFDKTIRSVLECIDYIRKHRIPPKIGISCTLQGINKDEISKMIDLCNFLGTQFLSINPISFCGSATEAKTILYLSADEIISCWSQICEAYKRVNPDFELFLGTFPMETKFLNLKYDLDLPVIHTQCSAGTTLYIDPHGYALPCYMLPSMINEMRALKKYLCYWDIINEPAEKSLNAFKPFISYAHSISKTDYDDCLDCPDIDICKGCPLIILSEPDSIQRCQRALKKISDIIPEFTGRSIPAINKALSWELDNNILHLSIKKDDYSSNREYQMDDLPRLIWLNIDGHTSITNIKETIRKDFSMLSTKELGKSMNDFLIYFWKEGVLKLRGSDE